MPRYVAFLRAINLGATRRFPMTAVRQCLAEAGYDDVTTHLATGNVLVHTRRRSAGAVRDHLEQVFAAAAGFEVPTVVLTPDELTATYAEARALPVTAPKRYVAFLPDPPPEEARRELATWDHSGEGVHLGARHLHWWLDGRSATEAVIFKPATLRRLGIPGATTRDLSVVATLAERWGAAARP